MKPDSNLPSAHPVNRRRFLKASGVAVAAGAVSQSSFIPRANAADNDLLRIGLVGCGGRGTGAAAQALAAGSNVRLIAMGDAFPDRLEKSLATVTASVKDAAKIDVPPERRFIGFDAYEKVIENVDVVLLATPPGFRPIHLKAAIDAGKHVFAEKPVAVDAPGIRSVIESCKEARRKKLAVVSGLCLRYNHGWQETIKRLHDGAAGEIRGLQANDFRGPIWVKPREPGQTDMEYQMRNWYYFSWLSGDFNVEQHVHLLDACSWIMKGEYPEAAYGIGGRQVRTGPEFGNIYDHHSVIYEYAGGQKLFAYCRQQKGCHSSISIDVLGGKGTASLRTKGMEIRADEKWRYEGEKNDHYQTEHDELFASIRSGNPINNGEYMAKSTLLAIMGRMATYTGKRIEWDQAWNSKEDLSPNNYAWDAKHVPPPPAIPGVTKFV
jgi:predicted dehydrogenase